jgi:hypothetical protein
MAHASNAHQVRPVSTMTPRRRPFDWSLVLRLVHHGPELNAPHTEAGYTTAPTTSHHPFDDSLDTGRRTYTLRGRTHGTTDQVFSGGPRSERCGWSAICPVGLRTRPSTQTTSGRSCPLMCRVAHIDGKIDHAGPGRLIDSAVRIAELNGAKLKQ